ncbi:MAG: methyl-accepting chemotaxis protein [Thermotogota bacterium]
MKTITQRILMWFTGALVVFMIILGFGILTNVRQTIEPLIENSSSDLSEQTAKGINHYFEGIQKELEIYTKNSLTKTLLWEVMKQDLNEINDEKDYLKNIFIIKANGDYRNTDGIETNVSKDPIFTEVMKKDNEDFHFSGVRKSLSDNDEVIVISQSIKDAGMKLGIIGAEIDTEALINEIAIESDDFSFSFILDSNGNIVAENSKIRNFDFNALNNAIKQNNKKIKSFNVDGNRFFAFDTSLKIPSGWSVGRVISEEFLFQGHNSLIRFITIFMSILIVIMVILSYLIARMISKPLIKFSKKLNGVADGDFKVQFDQERKDEIGKMGTSLNNLTKALRNSFSEINTGVENVDNSSKELSDLAQQSSATSEELDAQAQDIDNNINGIKERISNLSTAMDEMTNSSQNISGVSQDLNSISNDTSTATEESFKTLKNIIGLIEKTARISSNSKDKVSDLSDSAENVGQIVETIDSITEQTNLLALNAAIEAARAGEAGKGFAVVADEIRKLAEDSSKATEEIAKILNVIKDKTKQTVEASDITEKSVNQIDEEIKVIETNFKNIESSVNKMNDSIENLSATAQEQSASAEEINSSIHEINSSISDIARDIADVRKSSDEQSSSSQSISANSEELAALADNLNDQIKRYKF